MGSVVNIARYVGDSLTNLVSRLGTDRDKASHSIYGVPLLTDEQISNSYRGAWLPRKIVDIPALDSCRNWRNWQAKEGEIEKIEAEEKRLDVRGKVLEARTKARLLGGAAILIGTGEEDMSAPLDVDAVKIGGVQYLTVFTRRQLTAGELERDPASPFYGRPSMYRLQGREGQSVDVHPSRLAVFYGNAVADEDMAAHRGWGDSVLVSVMDAIKNADSTAANIASLVFEAKVDVIKMPGLMNRIGEAGYEEQVVKRYTLASTNKGINGTLILDGEEEYETKSASFSTLPDILDLFLQIVSGAADIPATRLLGQSPAGLNSTGESDLRNYYDRISASQEIDMTPALFRLDEALIRSATGRRDPGIHYRWAPLWQMTDKERADVAELTAKTAALYAREALIPIDVLVRGVRNRLVEDGTFPGIEAAYDEAAKATAPDDGDDDLTVGEEGEVRRVRMAANDAEPRPLYVRRDVKNGAAIIAWAKAQGFTSTLDASDLHVTIAFSRNPVDWMAVGESWEDEIKIAVGGPRMMEQFGEATVLLIPGRTLKWRHEEVKEAGASWDHDDYQPHITISYGGAPADMSKVQPYQGEIVLGPEVFEDLDEDWKPKVTT